MDDAASEPSRIMMTPDDAAAAVKADMAMMLEWQRKELWREFAERSQARDAVVQAAEALMSRLGMTYPPKSYRMGDGELVEWTNLRAALANLKQEGG